MISSVACVFINNYFVLNLPFVFNLPFCLFTFVNFCQFNKNFIRGCENCKVTCTVKTTEKSSKYLQNKTCFKNISKTSTLIHIHIYLYMQS